MHRSRLAAAIILALTLGAIVATSASAVTTPLGGSPLNVYVGDHGELQAFRAGQANGIFYRPSSPEGDAGFFLALPVGTPTVYGFRGNAGPTVLTPYTIGTQTGPTGSGSAADPLKLVTTYGVSGVFAITQTTTYVNGSQQFRIVWNVRNAAAGALHFKALAAADFYFEGSDRGTGIFTQGPPRFIGGTNADTGSSGGFEEVAGSPAWSAYQALPYGGDPSEVWGKVEGSANTAQTFDNSVVGEQVDNAGGVEWDQYVAGAGLAIGASVNFELVARSAVPSALQITPPNAGSPQGVPINFTVSALDTNSQPYAGKTIRYQIVGPNATTGAVTTNAAGSAIITDPGTKAGADTVIAFLDFNNNGVREAVEPQASALGTFVDNIPPSCTVKVSGDRPGGSGGVGKPLIITVKCGEQATVTLQTSLQQVSAKSRAASVDKKKKRKKKVTIKLKTRTVIVTPGKSLAVSYKIPQTVRRKYAGKTVKITTTVKARDVAGNVKTAKATRTVKFAKYKRKKKGRH
jgi:hypothetical protein